MPALYNEIDPYAAEWLRNLIKAGHIAPGVVDERSIVDLTPADLAGFTQVHLFAGIGGWSLAARLAGWPDNRPLWTGSCPCQPFSVAGVGAGQADARHLWPEMFRLIDGCRPDVVMGEQVAAAVGKSWLDGVFTDLESIGYAAGAAVVPACAVNAPHRRDRLWFVANDGAGRRSGPSGRQVEQPGRAEIVCASDSNCHVADDACGNVGRCSPESLERCERQLGNFGVQGALADSDQSCTCQERQQRSGQLSKVGCDSSACNVGDGNGSRPQVLFGQSRVARSEQSATIGASRGGAWNDSEWITGHDGKARRVKPGVRLLAHGIPARVGKLRALGNAIVPQVAAEIIGAYMDATNAT